MESQCLQQLLVARLQFDLGGDEEVAAANDEEDAVETGGWRLLDATR